MADRGQHGEGEHDKRDVTMPTVPGAGFVMIKSEFVLRCLEAILDRPAMAFDLDQGLDTRPSRTLEHSSLNLAYIRHERSNFGILWV